MYIIQISYGTNQNMSDIDCDLSRSLKFKYNGLIGLTIYGFLLMVNSNI